MPTPAASPQQEIVSLDGHLLDSMVFPKVLDAIVEAGATYVILEPDVGATRIDQSHIRWEVSCRDEEALAALLEGLQVHGVNVEYDEDAELVEADQDGVLPEGFYSTTNFATAVRLDGHWVNVERPEMDCAIVVSSGVIDQVGDFMRARLCTLSSVGPTAGRRTKRRALAAVFCTAIGAVLLMADFGSAAAYGSPPAGLVAAVGAASATSTPTTGAPATPATSAPATSAPATTVPTTAPTTEPTTATTSVTTTTEPSTTTTTTASTTSTTKRRVVVGIAATRGIVVTEQPGNAQSGWIAFGILLVVVLGLAIAWWVHERRRQEPGGSTNKPVG